MSVQRRQGRLPDVTETFPRLQARTRRFTLGASRDLTVCAGGERVLFLRSRGGEDPVTCLWCLDVGTGREQLLADPLALETGDEDLPPPERARRERLREQAAGIVSYSIDRDGTLAAFVVSGTVHVVDVGDGRVRSVATDGGVVDPQLDPTGQRVGFVSGGTLQVHELGSGTTTTLAAPEADAVSWGLPEFAAAEEMGRLRGYWWSPDGQAVLAARVDEAPVHRWHIADPANPDREPIGVRYPAAGTPNAGVSLAVLGLDGGRTPVPVDDEYLAAVLRDEHELLLTVQSRDQRRLRLLAVDPATGSVTARAEQTDPAWVDLVPGVPAHLPDGALVTTADSADTRRLVVDGVPVTPPGLQVRAVRGVDGDVVLFTGSTEPTEVGLWTWRRGGTPELLTPAPGVFDGRRRDGMTAVTGHTMDGPSVTVHGPDGSQRALASHAVVPELPLRVQLLRAGPRQLRSALLLPSWHSPGTPLPVLLDPYGGPHSQRVLAARGPYLTSQWFAEQGFAVLVADGRGTPGRGPGFERAVHGDLATPVLDDQVAALHAVAAEHADLDLDRVAIRGWSFGGYLAALAVLRRPDVIHAAIAGAPVTDWRLYDTHYTERYLGDPAVNPPAYEHSSLLADADALRRPLLLVHGLSDDNVVAAHTLRLSSALLAAGRPHSVLPLSGVTHMTPQEVVAENLLLLQVEFLQRSLPPAAS